MTIETGVERGTVTVEQAARRLGIGRTLAYELAARGELPVIRLGRKILVSKRGLERILEGQRVGHGDADGRDSHLSDVGDGV